MILIPRQCRNFRQHCYKTSVPKPPSIRAQVSSKAGDGNTIVTLRIVTTKDAPASIDFTPIQSLREKHPPLVPIDNNDPITDASFHQPLTFSNPEAYEAVLSLTAGSSGGFTLRNLLNLLWIRSPKTLTELTKFLNLYLSGKIPTSTRPLFSVLTSAP